MSSRNQSNYQHTYFGSRENRDFENRQQQQPAFNSRNNSLTSKIGRNAPPASFLSAAAESTGQIFAGRASASASETRFQNNKPTYEVNKAGGWKSKKTTTPFAESLVLQAHLRDVKAWSKYKCGKLDMLFDLHAVVGSEYGVNEYGGVTFVLRDSTDSLPVVYYEIESDLPEIVQGDWVRAGGTPRPWGFQITSVEKTSSTAYLDGYYEKVMGSRLALQRRVRELNLDV